jgi:hypothetical protein
MSILHQLCADLARLVEDRALPCSFLLAMIPLVVFSVVGAGKPATEPAQAAVVVRAVLTEGVRAQRQDDETFRRRWDPVLSLPPAIEVRYAREGVADAAVPGPVTSPPAPSVRGRLLKSKPARLDICGRHRMVKRYYTRGNGWKYWRCRR